MTRSLIELFNKSGIETSKLMKFLSETKGGVENLGFSNQDVRNVIRDIRRRVFDLGDAECGLLLLREQQENSFGNFFYRVDVDDENRVQGLTEFNACVYKSLTPTEFEGRWEQLVEKYDLEDHAWLNDMYAIRTQSIGAYTKQHFSAGMTTTSRSESTNSFFDEYMQSSTGLKEFNENSQKALETQYLKEVKSDYDTEQLKRRLVLHSSLEMLASEIYTKEMFKRFQKELMKSTCYIMNSAKNNGTYMSKLYLVEKATLPENCRRKYRVTVFMYEKIGCSCKNLNIPG
ncbi:protein FAR1-RELATED SEQUENCE 5-like [Apium graveolens]|uniref:protein FAR1-RELATED SEQUENCE 5-like n=1 Tax=Apium graveolens TaxID=4045 RepID=UPI003D7BC091